MNQIEAICREYKDALRLGSAPRIEDFLGKVTEQSRSKLLLQLIAIEISKPQLASRTEAEYLARFPEFEDSVRAAFSSSSSGDTPRKSQGGYNTTPTELGIGDEKTLAPNEPLTDDFAVGRREPSGKTVSQPFDEATLAPISEDTHGAADATLPPATPGMDTLTQGSDAGVTVKSIAPNTKSLGEYEIVEEIARGGMGVVYKARQRSLNRIVALKMILAGQFAGEEDIQRFHAEAEAAANLDHPGIVPIYDVGEHEGQHYFSMGYVDGQSLADKIQEGPLPARQAAEYAKAVADAMAFAHDRGVIHRDLKPANVLVDASGQPKVTDFGLAKQLKEDSGLTATGQVLGTPNYMPPEQASGKLDEVTETSDVYSIGAILYCLLTGRPPFQAATPMDTLLQVLEREPPAPRVLNPQTPKDLDTIVLKCLDKDCKRRYTSASELRDELNRYLVGEPILAHPISRLERTWRWCKRKPLVSSLTAALAGLLLAVFVSVLVIAPMVAWRESSLRNAAEQAREEIAKRKERADQELYARSIALAYQEVSTNNIRMAERRLDSMRNEFRGWEWDFLKSLCHTDLFTLRGHRTIVRKVRYSQDGENLISLGLGGMVFVWDPKQGRPKHSQMATGIGISNSGNLVAVNDQGSVRLVSAFDDRTSLVLSGHAESTAFAAFSSDDKLLATCGSDRMVRVWDLESGKATLEIREPEQTSQHDISFSPDGRMLAWKTKEGYVVVHDAISGEQRLRWREDRGGTVPYINVSFSPDSKTLATSGYDGRIRLYEADSGKLLSMLRGHKGFVYSVDFSPDGKRLASAAWDNTIRIWNVAESRQIASHPGHGLGATYGIFDVCFSPDGETLASGGADGTIKIWDAHKVEERLGTDQDDSHGDEEDHWQKLLTQRDANSEFTTISEHVSAIESIDFSPDGTKLVTGSWDNTAKVHDILTGRTETVFLGHNRPVGPVAFSHDGSLVASGTGGSMMYSGGAVYVWKADTGEVVHEFEWGTNEAAVSRLAFLPGDQKLVVTGGSQLHAQLGAIKIYDLENGKLFHEYEGVNAPIRSLAVHPSGENFVTGGHGGKVMQWSVGEARLMGHTTPGVDFYSLAFSPDGEYLVGGGTDFGIRYWHVADKQEIWKAEGHNGIAFDLVFSPDGKRVASVSPDSTVRIWNASTGDELLVLRGHDHEAYGVRFSPDGKLLASSSYDGTVNIRGDMSSLSPESSSYDAPPMPNDDWVELFVDDFERTELGDSWELLVGEWSVVDGAFKGIFQSFPRLPGFNLAAAMPKELSMPSTVELSFDLWTPSRQICEIKLSDAKDIQDTNTVLGMFMTKSTASYNSNNKGTLINGANSGVFRTINGNSSVWMQPNVKYHVRILRYPRRMEIFVDGQSVVAAGIPFLDAPFLRLQGGFGKVGDSIFFDNLTVRAPRKSLVESEALGIVERLFDEYYDKAKVRSEIEVLPDTTDQVRSMSLEILERKSVSPIALNQAAWMAATQPNRSKLEYEKAVKQARTAVKMMPSESSILNTLAVAQYRAEQFEEAAHSIQRTLDLDLNLGRVGAANLMFAAMIHKKLGNNHQAAYFFDFASQKMEDPGVAQDAEKKRFFEEAKALFSEELAAYRPTTIRNLKAIAKAHHEYHQQNGKFARSAIESEGGRPLLSWRVALLPLLGENELYNEFKMDEPWDSSHNLALLDRMPKVYRSAAGLVDKTNYQLFVGPGSVFEPGVDVSIKDILDGTTQTVLCVEGAEPVEWTQPRDLEFALDRPLPPLGASTSGRVSFALANGAVKTHTAAQIAGRFKGMITRAGRELDDVWFGPPMWIEDREHPFDIQKYWDERQPSSSDTAAEHRRLLSQLGPFPEKYYSKEEFADIADYAKELSKAASWESLKDRQLPTDEATRLLERSRPILDRIDQLHGETNSCLFVNGILGAEVPWANSISALEHLTRLEIYVASSRGDFEASEKAIRRSMRLSNDLRRRSAVAMHRIANQLDASALRSIVSRLWVGTTPSQCANLIAILQQHIEDTQDSVVEAAKAEYVQWQEAVWRIRNRQMTVSGFAAAAGVSNVRTLLPTQLNFELEARAAKEVWSRYLRAVQLPLPQMLDDESFLKFTENLRQLASNAKLPEEGQWPGPVLVGLSCPNNKMGIPSYVDLQLKLSGILAGTCVRRYALVHGAVPVSLHQACADADVRVPVDPYDGQPFKFEVFRETPRVYSVGRDRIDSNGKLEWKDATSPGYTVLVSP